MPVSFRNAWIRGCQWGIAGVLLVVLGGVFGLAAIPTLFGKYVGAGFASVDRSLCALGADGSAKILIGGDSRAKVQVDPLLLDSLTGRKAINIAENVNLGGDLITLTNVLRKYPRVLAARPVLLVSVSVSGHNDVEFGGMTAAAVLNWGPRDHLRAALRKPAGYLGFAFGWYLPFLKRLAFRGGQGGGLACDEDVHLPEALLRSRGYRPNTRVADSAFLAGGDRAFPASRDAFLLDGGRRRAFSEALGWLADSPIERIVLYNAPIHPGWRRDPKQALALEMEAAFAALVAADAARHPKARFIDFVADAPADLEAIHFSDNYHLNHRGAALFTRRLAGYLEIPVAPPRIP